jgi:hypothetical protein
MCMTYEQSCDLWYKKLKIKVVNIFSMIWNYDKFSKWNVEFGKICTLLDNSIYSRRVNRNHVIYWVNFRYFYKHVAKTIFQKFLSMKNSKWPQRTHL